MIVFVSLEKEVLTELPQMRFHTVFEQGEARLQGREEGAHLMARRDSTRFGIQDSHFHASPKSQSPTPFKSLS